MGSLTMLVHVKGTPEIQLSLKSQNFSGTIIKACCPGGHFWGYLTRTHSFIQATHLKIGYLIFHELQRLNKHERVTGWLPQHWPPPASLFSFPIQKDLFSFHTTVLCTHLEKWHSKLVKYKWIELIFYHLTQHLTQQYYIPLALTGWG